MFNIVISCFMTALMVVTSFFGFSAVAPIDAAVTSNVSGQRHAGTYTVISTEDEYAHIANDILDISKAEEADLLEEMYEDIPEEQIDELEDMSIEELHDDIDALEDEYEVGEPFNDEDQNKVLFAYEKYGDGDALTRETDGIIQPVNFQWRNYKVGSSKSEDKVTVSYSGYIGTYCTYSTGTYYTDVTVKIKKGASRIKGMYWKTSHTCYGLLGINGKSVRIGISYNGSLKSKTFKSGFRFDKSKDYNTIVPFYMKTRGKLHVTTKKSDFSFGTTMKESWE